MEEQKDIMVTSRLGEVPLDSEAGYLAHLLCFDGTCRYRFNERDFELHEGDLSIVRKWKLIENIHCSEDFRCKIIYAKPGFIELCTPQTNYGTKGPLSLFDYIATIIMVDNWLPNFDMNEQRKIDNHIPENLSESPAKAWI